VTREDLVKHLEVHGVTPTTQRLDVAEVILSHPQHASADQVMAGIKSLGSSVSKATVYNTLNLFCERGLLRTVTVDPTRQFYDPTIQAHHHFYNVDSGELTDIAPDSISMRVSTPLPPGTETAGVDVVIRVRESRRTS
jgi:Fur family iron response transcriptional regulator